MACVCVYMCVCVITHELCIPAEVRRQHREDWFKAQQIRHALSDGPSKRHGTTCDG